MRIRAHDVLAENQLTIAIFSIEHVFDRSKLSASICVDRPAWCSFRMNEKFFTEFLYIYRFSVVINPKLRLMSNPIGVDIGYKLGFHVVNTCCQVNDVFIERKLWLGQLTLIQIWILRVKIIIVIGLRKWFSTYRILFYKSVKIVYTYFYVVNFLNYSIIYLLDIKTQKVVKFVFGRHCVANW